MNALSIVMAGVLTIVILWVVDAFVPVRKGVKLFFNVATIVAFFAWALYAVGLLGFNFAGR